MSFCRYIHLARRAQPVSVFARHINTTGVELINAIKTMR